MIYAYIRVSTKHQNIDRQYEEIKALDIDDKYIYIDMNEKVESLNVATAAAITLYEINK